MNRIALRPMLCGAAILVAAHPADGFASQRAQDDAPAPTPTASKTEARGTTDEEIIVTAQRRAENLQDVPVTITVFGAEEIQQARIQQVDDLVTRTPGLNFDAFPASQPRLFIRGIGSADRGAAGDPSSAVFVDDIYMGRPAAIAFDAFDVERIEILKGPQGTLFGRNVVGGAINVITRRPEPAGFDAGAEVTYGNYDRVETAGFINLPFGENTGAIRVSGAYRRHDGYVSNDHLGTRVDDQDSLSGRFQFLGEPSESFRFNFTLDGTRDRSRGPANHILGVDESDPLSAFYSVSADPEVTYGSENGFQNRDTYGVRAELAKDLSFGTLTFLGSYRYLRYANRYDFDGGNPDPSSPAFNLVNIGGGNDEEAELSSQELRLSSLADSPVTWVVGLYHYHQRTERADIFTLDAPAVAPIALTEIYDQTASLDSVAVFGDLSVPLSERVKVFGGLRYSRDYKTSWLRNTDSMVPLRGDEFIDARASATFDDVTYRFGAEFKPAPGHLLYATVSRGFKSGGFQDTPPTALDAVTPFEPETAVQYEIGQKSTLLGGSMTWNNSLFYVDYSNLQTGQAIDGRIIVSNAGKATIKGYETQLDFNSRSGFQLSLAYAFTDAKFDEFFEGGNDYSGNRISRAPEHKFTASPSYAYSLPGGVDITLAADYRYTSKIFDDNSNLPPEFRDPTHFVDARLMIEGFADGLSLSIWGKNLTDERTRTFQAIFLGGHFAAFSPPRTFGATLRWDY